MIKRTLKLKGGKLEFMFKLYPCLSGLFYVYLLGCRK